MAGILERRRVEVVGAERLLGGGVWVDVVPNSLGLTPTSTRKDEEGTAELALGMISGGSCISSSDNIAIISSSGVVRLGPGTGEPATVGGSAGVLGRR